jgi:hypothetical protein
MLAKLLAIWNYFNGKKLIIAGYMAFGVTVVQLMVMDEFAINPMWWTHFTSIIDKIIVLLGGVGVGHKVIKAFTVPKEG